MEAILMNARKRVLCVMLSGFGLAAAACTTLSPQECASTDWYRLGERDGFTGGLPQIAKYSEQCAAGGARADGARYEQGYQDGVRLAANYRSGLP
jgi:hypothetical protein